MATDLSIRRQRTPVGNLTWHDILLPRGQAPGASLSDDFIPVDIKAAIDHYNYVQCNWSDRVNSYNNDLLNQQNDAAIALYGRRMESAQDWGFICLRAAAQWALGTRLGRNCTLTRRSSSRCRTRGTSLSRWTCWCARLELPAGSSKIEEDENQEQAIEAENFVYGLPMLRCIRRRRRIAISRSRALLIQGPPSQHSFSDHAAKGRRRTD